ncbi:hypothetical protein QBC37DRAFT_438351 [Rhypophila decipiens]|uniref:CFEM domain-containing protein n=1 Tax=Rhypophila decipiens TaxID=261697 RepID=A0AAN6YER2_9PEZI|nr:hypothetical protein QBC37DRAFT_438351 [Rhypophila decipiens]
MSPSRMAFKPFLFLTLLWTTLSTVATAERNTGIPSEITDFVPYCARDCFRSFITANFGSSGCGSSPSLECLCRRTGASGYTLGEGAYACSVAEASREKCRGADADTGVPVEAYNMCSQVSNAAPATHDTIVATLIIPSGTGGLVVPTAAPTSASPTSSTTTTSPTRSTPTPTSIESSETPVPSSSPSRLSAPQIAGISLGVIAGVVAFGVLLIFLARCIRRRRFGDEDSEAGFAKMRDSLSYHQGSPPALHGGLQISNPIRKPTVEMDFQRPLGAYNQYYGGQPAEYQQPAPEPVHPGMIGVAISPNKPVAIQSNSNANMTAANSASKIGFAAPPAVVFTPPSRSNTMDQVAPSPPKPALTLAIPKGRAPTTGARDSIVTEFAEDGEGESNPNTSSIWRPPPSEPQSASTYYYADKGGNWVLRRASTAKKPVAANRGPVSPQMEELPSPEDRTRAERAQDFPVPVVRPLRISKNFQPQLGSPIAFKDQARANRSSSIYTSNNTVPPTSTYYAMMREGRDLTGGGRAKQQQQQQQQQRAVPSSTRNKRVSYQSSTSIESGAAGPFDDDEDIIENEPQVSLSPVAQSPLTPLEGKSPVSYPKIHKNGARLSLFPPPSTAVRDNSRSPPGQASPTLGASAATKKTTPQTAPNKRLLYPGGLGLPSNPNPNRNPGQIKTGSPETRVGVFPTAVPISAPPVAELPATPPRRPSPARAQQGLGISEQRQRQYHQRPLHQQQQQQQQQMYQAPSQVQQQRQQQRPAPAPSPHIQMQMQSQPQRYPSPPQYQQPQQPQPYQPYQPPATVSASSPEGNQSHSQSQAAAAAAAQQSSLLAKRLGAEKAAALSLGASGSGDTITKPTKRREKWTRESFGPKTINTKGNKQAVHDDDDLPYPVPITPGWVPQLTPTKRGDDLYLNVQ